MTMPQQRTVAVAAVPEEEGKIKRTLNRSMMLLNRRPMKLTHQRRVQMKTILSGVREEVEVVVDAGVVVVVADVDERMLTLMLSPRKIQPVLARELMTNLEAGSPMLIHATSILAASKRRSSLIHETSIREVKRATRTEILVVAEGVVVVAVEDDHAVEEIGAVVAEDADATIQRIAIVTKSARIHRKPIPMATMETNGRTKIRMKHQYGPVGQEAEGDAVTETETIETVPNRKKSA
jgi:hypothetical protein